MIQLFPSLVAGTLVNDGVTHCDAAADEVEVDATELGVVELDVLGLGEDVVTGLEVIIEDTIAELEEATAPLESRTLSIP